MMFHTAEQEDEEVIPEVSSSSSVRTELQQTRLKNPGDCFYTGMLH